MKQQDLHQQLRAEAIATRERLAGLLRPLDPSQVAEHPEPTGWSLGDVLEHLCVADALYEQPMADLLRGTRPDAGAPAREWKSSFIGGLIAGSLLKPGKLKAPRVFRPGLTPRDGFRIQVVHVTRHSRQVERIIGKL